jgi:glycosyltransferase involved in cell wall biosynthesis
VHKMIDGASHSYSDQPAQISVLIPTRERPQQLEACVESLLASDHKSFEIIVIDQSPEPCTRIRDPRLHVHHSSARGKSAALNAAMQHASGRLFAFTDDDCTVYPDWLTRGHELLEARADVDLVYGALLAIPHNPSLWFVPVFSPARLEVVSGAARARLRGGAGANMFARRQLFERIGGFDEAIGPGAPFRSCEEYDIYYRALRAGAKVLRDPENAVLHWGKRAHSDGSSQRLLHDYFYGEGAVLAKHVRSGDLVALRVSFAIMLRDLGFLTCSSLVRGNLTGPNLVAKWLSGFVRGLRTPVGASRRLFIGEAAHVSPAARLSSDAELETKPSAGDHDAQRQHTSQ